MKTLRLLCLGWLFLSVASGAHAQVPPARQEAELMTRPDQKAYGKLDGHGKLVFQELYQDDYPAEWYDTLVYYPYGRRQGLKLRNNLRAINVFLAAEFRRPRTVRAFFKEHLWHFLPDNLGESGTSVVNAEPINQASVNEHPDEYLLEADRRSASRRARLKAKLQGYVRSEHPVVAGNGWSLDANVITTDGAVEHWLVKGRVTPLQIDSFLCEPKEPRGTFKHYIQIFH